MLQIKIIEIQITAIKTGTNNIKVIFTDITIKKTL